MDRGYANDEKDKDIPW